MHAKPDLRVEFSACVISGSGSVIAAVIRLKKGLDIQFRLRTFFVGLTLFCVLMAVVAFGASLLRKVSPKQTKERSREKPVEFAVQKLRSDPNEFASRTDFSETPKLYIFAFAQAISAVALIIITVTAWSNLADIQSNLWPQNE